MEKAGAEPVPPTERAFGLQSLFPEVSLSKVSGLSLPVAGCGVRLSPQSGAFRKGDFQLKLYVGNLSFDSTDSDLRTAFEAHGEVTSAEVIIDRTTGRSRGFGFVEMPDETSARNAMRAINGTQLQGRSVVVNEAQERRPGGAAGGPRGPRQDYGRGGGGGRGRW